MVIICWPGFHICQDKSAIVYIKVKLFCKASWRCVIIIWRHLYLSILLGFGRCMLIYWQISVHVCFVSADMLQCLIIKKSLILNVMKYFSLRHFANPAQGSTPSRCFLIADVWFLFFKLLSGCVNDVGVCVYVVCLYVGN